MPSPIGHGLAAVAAGWLVAKPSSSRRKLLIQSATLAAIGVMPDLDLLINRHSAETHSIGAAAIVATFSALVRLPVAHDSRTNLAGGVSRVDDASAARCVHRRQLNPRRHHDLVAVQFSALSLGNRGLRFNLSSVVVAGILRAQLHRSVKGAGDARADYRPALVDSPAARDLSAAYSFLARTRMGTSASALFHNAKKSSYARRAVGTSPVIVAARARPT